MTDYIELIEINGMTNAGAYEKGTRFRGRQDQNNAWVQGVDILSPLSAFGEVLVAKLTPEAAWRFDYGVNTRLVSTTGTTGTVGADASRAKLETGTATDGVARVTSLRRLRYLPGMGGLARFTSVFATAKASTQQIIGIGDTQDGFFFGYDGTTFGVMRRRGGSDNWTVQADWNGSALQDTLNPQFGNIYQIRFQWLGYGLIRFFIFDKVARDYINVHNILYPNTSAAVHTLNPTLPLMAEVKNTGNNTNMVMYTPSAMAALEGTPDGESHCMNVGNSEDVNLTLSDTNNNHAITISNKTTLNSITNRVPIEIRGVDLSRATGAAISTVRIYKSATTAGTRTYSDVDATNSPAQYSTTTTTITGGTVLRTYILTSSNGWRSPQFAPGEFILQPGETMTIAIQNNQVVSTDFGISVNWMELF